jgi:tetratricopeptide (TPR) repeat protein
MSDDTRNLAAKYKISTPTQPDGKDTILVVEDQMDLRLIVVHQLQKLNFGQVKHCSNGYEAIEIIKSHEGKFSAYVSDMDMPVMGGLDLLAELRENQDFDRGPFCIAMDQVSREKLMLAVENGSDEILVKPFTLGDIGPKVRSAFSKFHNPANPEKVYELAKACLRDGKLDLAEKIYKDLAAHAPKAARPTVGLARIEAKRGKAEAALQLLTEAEQKNKNFVHLYTDRAEIYAGRGEFEPAIEAFKKAIDLSPLNAIRYKMAADLLFKVKRYQEAADLLEIALRHKLEFPDLYHFLSQAKFALKDFKAASKYIRSALGADAANVTYLNQLGICLKETDQMDEAMKVYNQIIKLDPANIPALYNKAVLLHAKGDRDEAIKILERVVKKNPDFAQGKAKLDEYLKESNAA